MDVTGLVGLAVAAAVLVAATGFGLWRRRRDGRARPAAAEPAAVPALSPVLAALGVEPGVPATLLQFSSAFCAPCRATRVVAGQVAAAQPGVRHLEVDAETHLDAVRALGIWRTPTVLVVDAAGQAVSRIVGQPTRAQVTEAVRPLLAQLSHS